MESIPNINVPILIVDDDISLLLSIRTVLLSAGMPEPALVSDTRRVINLVREHRFRLILLDIIMPHQSGIDILKQLKQEFPEVECKFGYNCYNSRDKMYQNCVIYKNNKND